jgi:hypothetical protein
MTRPITDPTHVVPEPAMPGASSQPSIHRSQATDVDVGPVDHAGHVDWRDASMLRAEFGGR